MFDVLNLFDKEFTIYIVIISIISIILLYAMLRIFLSHSTKLRVLFLSCVVYTFLFLIGITVYYVNTSEYMFYADYKYYIYGNVLEINDDYLILNATKSNLLGSQTGKIKVKLKSNTVYSIYANSQEKRVNLKNISSSSYVEIVSKESKAVNNQVTAMKVKKIVY